MITMRLCSIPRLLALVLLACLGAAATPGRVSAQDPDSARAVLERDGLCPGRRVQISTTFAERFSGECVLEDARLLVLQGESVQPVLYTAVDSIWVRGPATEAGTVTGAWVGAGLGGALGALFIALFCEFECGDEFTLYGVGGAVGGSMVGAATGHLVGRRMRVWIRLYPR